MKQNPKGWGGGRGQQQILGHPLSDANDQIQAGLIQDTWSKCYLLLLQIQDHLSSHLHVSTSPPATTPGSSYHRNSTMMAQELQFSKVDELSPEKILHQNNCLWAGLDSTSGHHLFRRCTGLKQKEGCDKREVQLY